MALRASHASNSSRGARLESFTKPLGRFFFRLLSSFRRKLGWPDIEDGSKKEHQRKQNLQPGHGDAGAWRVGHDAGGPFH